MKYESTDLPYRPFIVSWISFFVFLPLSAGIVWLLIVFWSRQGDPYQAVTPNQQNPRWNNGAPQLQIDPEVDLQTLKDREYARLHTTAWTDPSHTFAKIPIEDAMHMVVLKASQNQLNSILPTALPLTPLDLQNQKSQTKAP